MSPKHVVDILGCVSLPLSDLSLRNYLLLCLELRAAAGLSQLAVIACQTTAPI